MDPKRESTNKPGVNFTVGVVLGTLVAAGTTFLYKTQKGKKLRKQFRKQYQFAKINLDELVSEIKHQAAELERAEGTEETFAKFTQAKKRLTKAVTKSADQFKKKVFLKSGRRLLK